MEKERHFRKAVLLIEHHPSRFPSIDTVQRTDTSRTRRIPTSV
ncbi:hypothetical protein SAMN05216386_2215 [Nitrosospira briensis]|uniref:Uncharacterized protein n=1 Tax=Nitrosospira briensis TaxID=35799 RepID=A0A1I5D5P3_9PROT|nr:hypothetical protein SAMN05216386_2215 [Nitrosospira briensis]SFO18822.1 hypothetical protein SAMN05216332_10735 [Nitrosospira briensis]